MGKLARMVSLALAVMMLAGACGGGISSGGVAQAAVKRDLKPDAPTADLGDLVRGNTVFALDLYQALKGKGGNLFYSPFSISMALAMTYAGARGQTEAQMAETLHFTLPQERLHVAFNQIDQELASRGQGAQGKDGQGFRLNVVNALWAEQTYKFLDPFLDTLARNYGAGLRLVDFVKASDKARVVINDWVAEQTEDRIQDLIPEGVLNELTRLVLTNAIYFNAAWAKPFIPNRTADGTFYLLDGGEVTVPMMRQTEPVGYARGNGYQAVELAYSGEELSMILVVPDAGRFEAFEAALDAAQVEGIEGDLAPEHVALTLPKFEVESDFSLADALSALGMATAFTEDADLSGMDGSRDLLIADVIHKAFVSVDEAGTEAAAATAVIVQVESAPQEPVEVTIDRPFLFFIRDNATGAILFLGRVLDPSG